MIRIAVTGATGRMGGAVLAATRDRPDVEVALATSRSAGPARETAVAGTTVQPAEELSELLAAREPDALVDFTAPAASVERVADAAEAGVAAVVGTTGFDEDGVARLRAAAEAVPLLRASNFARGLWAMVGAVREAVAALPGYDVEVTETHHAAKRDAPSGTAGTLLEAVEAERGPAERVHGRAGTARRQPGEVGVHARRAGEVTGEHEVLLAGDGETLRLTHRAGSRAVFAAGALDAAAWLAGREPGVYDVAEVVA